MRLKCKVCIGQKGHYFFILMEDNLPFTISDETGMAESLGMGLEEYTELMIQNGGFLASNGYYYFRVEEKCRDFIEKIIDPKLINGEIDRINERLREIDGVEM